MIFALAGPQPWIDEWLNREHRQLLAQYGGTWPEYLLLYDGPRQGNVSLAFRRRPHRVPGKKRESKHRRWSRTEPVPDALWQQLLAGDLLSYEESVRLLKNARVIEVNRTALPRRVLEQSGWCTRLQINDRRMMLHAANLIAHANRGFPDRYVDERRSVGPHDSGIEYWRRVAMPYQLTSFPFFTGPGLFE